MEDLNNLSQDSLLKKGIEIERRNLLDNKELRAKIFGLVIFLRNKQGFLDEDQKETLRKLLVIAGIDLNEEIRKSKSVIEETEK